MGRVLAGVLAGVPVCHSASLSTCVPAYLSACLSARLPGRLPVCSVLSLPFRFGCQLLGVGLESQQQLL